MAKVGRWGWVWGDGFQLVKLVKLRVVPMVKLVGSHSGHPKITL